MALTDCMHCSVSVGRVAGQRVVNLDTLEHDEFHPDRYLDNFQNVVIVAFGGVQITRQFYLQVLFSYILAVFFCGY